MSTSSVIVPVTGIASQNIFTTLWAQYMRSLDQNPIVTKSLTSGLLNMLSDLVAQVIEARSKKSTLKLDQRRVLKFGGFGLTVSGPLFHFWYRILNDIVGSQPTTMSILIRIALDRLVLAPIFFTLFYIWNAVIDNKIEEVPKEIEKKLLPTVIRAMYLWIPAQYINFKFVPLELKVLYGNLIAVGWNIYFSLINNAPRRSPPTSMSTDAS